MTPAVGFMIFNRPEPTRHVFEAIRRARPPLLLVAADGPRSDVPSDAANCEATRRIATAVDWPCEVRTRFLPRNEGCGPAVSGALSWIFAQGPEAIILEDDCLPAPGFFRFCGEMLARYRDDPRMMLVCGTNALGEWRADLQSYHFSIYGGIWGWASWARAWKHYDYRIAAWGDPAIRARIRKAMGRERFERRRLTYDSIWRGDHVTTWDYQWGFARLAHGGLSVVPSRNLVSNIGCSANGTHPASRLVAETFGNRPAYDLGFPLRHPDAILPDGAYDRSMFDLLSMERTITARVLGTAKRVVRRFLAP